ncbi:MAG: FYDLN acid domain-containing protein [archaeon YNP-LCB-024-027]|jgi:DNA-directed RNA polymerase subunit RPC12/RpoP|nr:FYDLN acid domain-containing protein [Candidatus Culexarchaeum yellowstonense]
MPKARCPICDEMIDLGEKPHVGDVIECPSCGVSLSIEQKGRRWSLKIVEEEEEEEEEWEEEELEEEEWEEEEEELEEEEEEEEEEGEEEEEW